jgi:hypothetical protein
MSTRVTITPHPDLAGFPARLERAVDQSRGAIRTILAMSATSAYMRYAGARVGPRAPDDRGPLRIVTGRLSRSLTGALGAGGGRGLREDISDFSWSGGGGQMTFGTRVPYAPVHEEGWSGVVRAHTRTVRVVFGRKVAPHSVQVSAHPRTVRSRAFLSPAVTATQSLVLGRLGEAIAEALQP